MSNILVIGSINMDLVINTPRIPEKGETITGSGFITVPGGKGANQALACSRLGGNVKMIGCVGNDIYGDICVKNLEDNNIDNSCISKANAPTGVAVITVCNGDNTIIIDNGANGFVSQDLIYKNSDVIKWADIVIFQFEIPVDTVFAAAKLAKEYGKKIILNPAPMIKVDLDKLKLFDILIPNQHEAGIILDMKIENIENAKEAINRFLKIGLKQVIITLGSDGCVYNEADIINQQPAYKVDVADTTAAGDSFIAGLCTRLCKGNTIQEALEYATAVSAITVSRFGASSSIPDSKEVEIFIKERKLLP